MNIHEHITTLITDALAKLNLTGEIILEYPSDTAHGDISCNIAMQVAGRERKNPKELAQHIIGALESHEDITRIEVAGPGFINFYLSESFFEHTTRTTLSDGEIWGANTVNKGKTILIEHSSPNLFKPFHIGHLVNNTLGESIVRLTKATGATVHTLSFPSDVSPGIAKAVWGALDKGWKDELTIERIGEAYVHGVAEYETHKEAIDAINRALYEQEKGTPEWELYETGRELSLEYFQSITKRLGSEFDGFIFESESEVAGKEIVQKNTPGVFEESEGAIIFRGSEHGLFDNVFINSAGFGTYLTKDIGLLSLKFQKYTFDHSVTVTDIEQKQHFELVKKAAELIESTWAEKSSYIQHGRLSLTTGKISSRAGGVPLAEDILDTVKTKALEKMKENGREASVEVAEQIAIGAIKYAIVRVSMGKNIIFDLEQSLSFEGDSGPYLQYTHARACSIARKAVETGVAVQVESIDRKGMGVSEIERLVYRFPSIVERAATTQEPHALAGYLLELASAYNSWYAQEIVLDGSDSQEYKLALTHTVAKTLRNGLWVLGIEAPEEM